MTFAYILALFVAYYATSSAYEMISELWATIKRYV